jgi:hypothetical protein
MRIIAIVLAGMLGLAANAFAETTTRTGVISDSMCGASHGAADEHGTKTTDKQCTAHCVDHGAKYVFVADGKVLQIANQNFKTLRKFAGQPVHLTGDVKGDTITVTKIVVAKI